MKRFLLSTWCYLFVIFLCFLTCGSLGYYDLDLTVDAYSFVFMGVFFGIIYCCVLSIIVNVGVFTFRYFRNKNKSKEISVDNSGSCLKRYRELCKVDGSASEEVPGDE